MRAGLSAYSAARSRGAGIGIRRSEIEGWGRIEPGLRAILERCLDPDPARRYCRGAELAEDLDRWRTQRPLLYAAEPFVRHTVPRLVRRSRSVILAAALSALLVLLTSAIVFWKSGQTLQALSSHKLSRMWDDPDAHAIGFQWTNAPRLLRPDRSRIETATRALKEYDVLGARDWRDRDDVRALPRVERDDLEVWLMEQVYLYCRMLENRPNSPSDWRRAIKILDERTGPAPIPALAGVRRRLGARLETRGPEAASDPGVLADSSAPSWLNEYLLGVVAECEPEAVVVDDVPDGDVSKSTRPGERTRIDRSLEQSRQAAMRASEHYTRFLAAHPDSFWGHYRAAAVAYSLGGEARFAEAADHLEHCLKRRPNSPTLHNHRAACLLVIDQHQEAQQEIAIAISAAPDSAEFYRTRASIHARLGQTVGLADDLQRFESLSNLLPRSIWERTSSQRELPEMTTRAQPLEVPGPLDFMTQLSDRPDDRDDQAPLADAGPDEILARAALAQTVREAGEHSLAAAELDKILILKPDHIGVRMTRATQFLEAGRLDDAYRDIEAILANPGLVAYLRDERRVFAQLHEPEHRTFLELLHDASRRYFRHGQFKQGRIIAEDALELAKRLDQSVGSRTTTWHEPTPTWPWRVRSMSVVRPNSSIGRSSRVLY